MAIPLFDSHSDSLHVAWRHGRRMRENDMHLDFLRSSAFSPRGQVFSIWADPKNDPPMFDTIIDFWDKESRENGDLVSLCRNADEIRAAQALGKCAVILSIEGAEQIECNIDKLHTAHERGVSVIHICWNYDNCLTGSATDGQGGLSEEGKRFVKEAQSIGMVIDLSHISERAFWDVLELNNGFVLAGHSDAQGVFDNPRSLSDEQFKALIQIGGVAGLNLAPKFLGGKRDIEAVVAHAEYFLSLGGEKNVGLGTDLDGVSELPPGLKGIQDFGLLYEAMLHKNWSEELVQRIFYGNLQSFFERALS